MNASEPFGWPSAEHTLHGEGPDRRQMACLEWSRGEWHVRIAAFRLGAEILACHVKQNGAEQDALIFPFAYCWRQHIELAIKQLILAGADLLDRRGTPPRGHNLAPLWRRCRGLMEEIEPAPESLDNVDRVVGELQRMDTSGEEFRYPKFKDGTATLSSVDRLSFERINTALIGVSNFLAGSADLIDSQLQIKRELEREYLGE
jgi:hypothetical protein